VWDEGRGEGKGGGGVFSSMVVGDNGGSMDVGGGGRESWQLGSNKGKCSTRQEVGEHKGEEVSKI